MPTLTTRFDNALVYASLLHATQVRKASGVPYVAHLLSVAALAIEHGASEDEAIAALLHDAVEDQGGAPTADKIRGQFGDAVAELVLACSDTVAEAKTDTSADATNAPKPPWQERKEHHLTQLRHASSGVALITAADKLHNVRAIIQDYRQLGEIVWSRFNGGRDGTLWYYREVVKALGSSMSPSRGEDQPPAIRLSVAELIDELDRAVSELERLANDG